MLSFRQFILIEGGNIKVGPKGQEVSAAPFPVTSGTRDQVKNDIHQALGAIHDNFHAEHGEHLFGKEQAHLNTGKIYSGSTSDLMNGKIPHAEFAKHKPMVGDVDVQVAPEHKEKLAGTLGTGKRFGKYTVVGTKKHGNEISAVMRHDNGEHHQFDFQGVHQPGSEASHFLHSSNWTDTKVGIKGAHHKILLNAVGGDKQKFSITHGLRSRTDESDQGVQHPTDVSKRLFGANADHSKIHSFQGVTELIKKHIPTEQHQAIYDKFKSGVPKGLDNGPALAHMRKHLGVKDNIQEMKTVTNRSHPKTLTVKVGGREHGYKKYSWGLHQPKYGPLKDEQFSSKIEMKNAMEAHPSYNTLKEAAKPGSEHFKTVKTGNGQFEVHWKDKKTPFTIFNGSMGASGVGNNIYGIHHAKQGLLRSRGSLQQMKKILMHSLSKDESKANLTEEADQHAHASFLGASPHTHMGHITDVVGSMKSAPEGKKFVGLSGKSDVFSDSERENIANKQAKGDAEFKVEKSPGQAIARAYESMSGSKGKKVLHLHFGHDRKDFAERLKDSIKGGKIPELNGNVPDEVHVHYPKDENRSHGMSGTKMRVAAENKDLPTYRKHLGPSFSEKESKGIMDRTGVGLMSGKIKVKR